MKLLAIDGNSVLNRAFFGVHLLTTKDGVYTNALVGFLNILMLLLKTHKPQAVAIAFDVSRHTFRNDKYSEYKANRKGMPEELRAQLPLIKEILTDMGYRLATAEGYEGDDVLGTIASACEKSGDSCIIATGDRDCLQLISENVQVCLLKTKENMLYDKERFVSEYGFDPIHIIDLKALMGDSSDNIPGVKGIGEKTAMAIITENNSVKSVYEKLETIQATPRVKGLLANGREQAFLSYELATICLDAPVETAADAYVRGETDEAALRELLIKLEMFSYFDKLNISLRAYGSEVGEESESITPIKSVLNFEILKKNTVFIPDKKSINHISLLLQDDGFLKYSLADSNSVCELNEENAEAFLKAVFDSKIPIKTFKAKPLYKLARKLGYENINVAFDAELAAYLLNPSTKEYKLKELIEINFTDTVFEISESYFEIAALSRLCVLFEERLEKDKMLKLYNEIELPLCDVLSDMEDEGFCVDSKGLKSFGEALQSDIDLTKEQIFRLSGFEFNINSTKELGEVLFERLGLPSGKKTKTGYSTNIDVLESLADKHPIVWQIMEYRKLQKLHSTYVVGLLKEVGADGRVHSTFNQTETRTGRISSTEPNVQNIPVRTKLGSEMRRFFTAREGYMLIDADYSQIELRILSHIANDKIMQKAFLDKLDIHAITAAQVFKHPLETLPNELRSRAKAINFGIVYGISAYSLSQDINTSVSEAKEYINAYLETYNGVAEYMKSVVEQARKDGYVSTIYGRRRDLADINSTNKNIRAFAERVALNMPVQGTAADIIKLAMIRVYHRIKKEGLDARLILQVHDELIVEAPAMQTDYIKTLLKEEMEGAASLAVPLLVDVNSGRNWYDSKG